MILLDVRAIRTTIHDEDHESTDKDELLDLNAPGSCDELKRIKDGLDNVEVNSKVINWLDGFQPARLREQQLADKDLQPILNWKSSNRDPDKVDLYLCSYATKALCLCKHQLIVKSGVLYYKLEDSVGKNLLLLVPKSLHDDILHLCHDTKSSGHHGIDKTLQRVKRHFYGIT